jgi:hypothetical protein
MSVEAAAQDRVKYLLTIKRNERSPSSEIAAHHHRNAHDDGTDRAGAVIRRTLVAWRGGCNFGCKSDRTALNL